MSCSISISSCGSVAIAVVLEAWDEEVNLREIRRPVCLVWTVLTVMFDILVATELILRADQLSKGVMFCVVSAQEVDEASSGGEPVRNSPFWAVPARINRSMTPLSHECLITA